MQVDLDALEVKLADKLHGPTCDELYEAAPSLIAELREARGRIRALELAIGDCGCVPGRCEQSPDDALVYYGRICRAARLLQPAKETP